ncbi:MAG: YmdB family metallophosphoesterase [Candidatus Adiutrix sp.]|jgi:metallophosphoesterase (TIGR00282 family)|nr:YmdB family metallophosphoesterase [Candidatus Adiutrix sp.]
MTRLLFLGDIFGRPGRRAVRDLLPGLVGREEVDLALGNAENASGGHGLMPDEALELLDSGLAVLTGGNHTFRYQEITATLDRDPRVLRPANYPEPCPGRGWTVAETPGGVRVGVASLMGRIFMNQALDCPFRKADQILAEMRTAGALITVIDFHAETTSEKKALAAHLDGRAGALLGTHTHVPTADARLLPGGLAYMTDVGLCGPHDSIIGMTRESVLPAFLTGRPRRFEPAARGVRLNGVLLDFNDSGRAVTIRPVDLETGR